jgi:2-keto-4-pentenoate hydratase/2-oxohepta-3-ene-1,7-dioic acid hydratase in catechol pathway
MASGIGWFNKGRIYTLRIIRYIYKNHAPNFGIVEGQKVYELVGYPLLTFSKGQEVTSLKEISLLAPCEPTKVIAVAINFQGIEGFSPSMKEPLVFIKPATCVAAPGVTVKNPFPDLPMWGEAELAVVIKDIPKNTQEKDVAKGVLGFTIANDVTVDNIHHRDHHLARSKCPDGFCPLGPWIDTEFDTSDCVIEAVQNGEVIRRGRSSQHFWKWPKIVSWLSTWMTLNPWDVVITGNPPDTVGMRYVQDGDIYTAKIHGLGELTNKFS